MPRESKGLTQIRKAMAQNTQMEPYMAIATLSMERAAPTMTDTQAAASICDYPAWDPFVATSQSFLTKGAKASKATKNREAL
jgi:hypothetical protein